MQTFVKLNPREGLQQDAGRAQWQKQAVKETQMPTFGDNISLAAGAKSTNLFENTPYSKVNQNSTVRINLASVAANDGAAGANLNQTFKIGNTVYGDSVPLPALVSGQPMTDNGSYKMNEVTVTQPGTSLPSCVVTNDTGGTLVFKYNIFVSQQ
jgi:hypothetical protein